MTRRRHPPPEEQPRPLADPSDARWMEGRREGLRVAISELSSCRESLAEQRGDPMLLAVLNELIKRLSTR